MILLDAYITVAVNSLIEHNITLEELSKKIVDKYVHFSTTCNSDTDDGVHTYACEVMTLGLLWRNYYDSVREGDGKRVLSIWKYLLLIFKARKRSNYSKEAAILLLQYHFIFSDRLRMQLLTSTFINTEGRVGCNLPSDLHMEKRNHLKEIIHHQGSNISLPH